MITTDLLATLLDSIRSFFIRFIDNFMALSLSIQLSLILSIMFSIAALWLICSIIRAIFAPHPYISLTPMPRIPDIDREEWWKTCNEELARQRDANSSETASKYPEWLINTSKHTESTRNGPQLEEFTVFPPFIAVEFESAEVGMPSFFLNAQHIIGICAATDILVSKETGKQTISRTRIITTESTYLTSMVPRDVVALIKEAITQSVLTDSSLSSIPQAVIDTPGTTRSSVESLTESSYDREGHVGDHR